MTLKQVRLALWVRVALAAIGATAIFFLMPPRAPGPLVAQSGLAVTGKPFALASTTGETFTEEDLKGTPSLVFFGYTFCPDVCPTTLAETAAWRQELGIGYDRLRTIFVTVDPERDTAPVLVEYLGGFDPAIIGLVGSDEQTANVKSAFGAQSQKEGDGEFYLVSHTASVFLIGADGRFEGTIDFQESRAAALEKIKRLVGG